MAANLAGGAEGTLGHPVVGLVGCGTIGRFHSRNIRGVARSELVPVDYAAVADLQRERAEQFAEIAGVPGVYEAGRELLDVAGLSAVYICTQTSQHARLVEAAAARPGHLL